MGLQKCGLNLNRDQKELLPHGTPDFPCAGYSSKYTDRPEDIIPWHWHEELEIIYLESGSLLLRIPEKTYQLKQGDGFIINSNVLHFAAADPVCKLNSVVFSPLLITGSDGSAFAKKYISPLIACPSFDGCRSDSLAGEPMTFGENFTAAFHALSACLPGSEFTVREALSKICFSLYQSYAQDINIEYAPLAPDGIRIRRMLDYIHKHFSEPLRLPQIACAADIGERECLRCFRKMLQISPVQYLLKYRVTQGASLLLNEPDKSICDVAGECGFDSPANFSSMFRRYYNCSPKEYRNGKQE